MFGLKLSKNGKNKSVLLKDSIEKSSEIASEKFSEGLKLAGQKIDMMKNYLEKNQDDIQKAGKTSGFALVSLMGVGLLAFGVYSLMRK
ncbi:MAG: hypothetical protein WC197_04055 [Candidatus Gastranaerophilaceae bacterium]